MGLKLKVKTGLVLIICFVYFSILKPFSLEKKNKEEREEKIKKEEEEKEEKEEQEEIKRYYEKIKKKQNTQQVKRQGTEDIEWRNILLWTEFFHSSHVWAPIFKRLTSGECEENRCKLTLNRHDIAMADAVIFNAYNLMPPGGSYRQMADHVVPLPPPKTRNDEQVYVFYSMEPPTKIDAKYISTIPKNFFNWTMGYRRDSDVYEPFGKIVKREKKIEVEFISLEELQKKKMAVWITSSCYKRLPYLREEFVTKLREVTRIDVFGECGKKCDNSAKLEIYGKEIGETSCEKLIQNYVFYLALENSFCTDYVTEKVYKAWKLGAIPVVFGAGNYSLFAPPNSYIDYQDFNSINHLAEYMERVASNASLYNMYFKWNSNYEVELGNPYKPFVCDLCKKLHGQGKTRMIKMYPSIYDWFVRKSRCQNKTKY
ncbi:UNVERIFIED_CONTAM: hypothetical protein RMT77_015824 [Armadillidium vulgare]